LRSIFKGNHEAQDRRGSRRYNKLRREEQEKGRPWKVALYLAEECISIIYQSNDAKWNVNKEGPPARKMIFVLLSLWKLA
jgi:hypothetical protein